MSEDRLRAMLERCVEFVDDAAAYHKHMSDTYGRRSYQYHDRRAVEADELATEVRAELLPAPPTGDGTADG